MFSDTFGRHVLIHNGILKMYFFFKYLCLEASQDFSTCDGWVRRLLNDQKHVFAVFTLGFRSLTVTGGNKVNDDGGMNVSSVVGFYPFYGNREYVHFFMAYKSVGTNC
jgi:hypothetical protein